MLQNVNSFVLQDSRNCLKKRSRKVLSGLCMVLITRRLNSSDRVVLPEASQESQNLWALFLLYLQSALTSVAVWSYLVQVGSSELSPEVPNPDYIWTIIRAHLFLGCHIILFIPLDVVLILSPFLPFGSSDAAGRQIFTRTYF